MFIMRTLSPNISDVWESPAMMMISFKESVDGQSTPTAIPYPTLKPALSPSVETNITIVYITLYAVLFLFVYVQLWMIWYYRHKRFSYQTVFLFCCLVWSGLRTTLFSFYFKDCDLANDLPISLYWLLYCFPVCLQFTMLCLLVLFFAQVVFKAKAKYEPSKYKKPLRILMVAAIVLFVASNVACAVAVRIHQSLYKSVPMVLLYMRVAINDSLFMILAVALAVCIFRMAKLSSSSLVLEAKGTSVCQAVVVSALIVLLFTSRAVYNFITISPLLKKELPDFGYDWVNVSDQAETVKNLSQSFAYVSFGVVLFIWEVLPITVVVLFFRVKRQQTAVALTDFSSGSYGPKVFFFDNPRRYDSEDDMSRVGTRSPVTSGYHSVNNSSSSRGTPRGTPIMATGSLQASFSGSSSRTYYGAIVRSGNPASVSCSPLCTPVLLPPPRSASVTLPPGVTMDTSSGALMASHHHAVMILPENSVMHPPARAILSAPTLQKVPFHGYGYST